ncbi:thioredoxin domain-containing protein [Caldiplasma sukawensis]
MNHLKNSKSPYLMQHADNPVDWYPWGEEAFLKAKKENKLLFISIGYSTCHWCHVMERESFSRKDVAEVMNNVFICIKVDREEHPTVDARYMEFAVNVNGNGGWPLNIIALPDGKPVFAFTYLPRETRRGVIGIKDLAKNVNEIWKNEGYKIIENGETYHKDLSDRIVEKREIDYGELEKNAYNQLTKSFDNEFGGFGNSTKFPTPHILSFLSNYYMKTGEKIALDMAMKTVASMRMGGIYDHVEHGIHRYSTDAGWKVPHFEKMLYDQAGIISAATDLFIASGKSQFKNIVLDTFYFLNKVMRSESGGFVTAIDADSDGEEGLYYTWTYGELKNILRENFEEFEKLFNIKKDGNFFDEARGISTGRNILFLDNNRENVNRYIMEGEYWIDTNMNKSLDKLKEARKLKRKPLIDTKVCSDLNGFLLFSMSKAARTFSDEEMLKQCSEISDFIVENMTEESGNVFHVKYDDYKIDGYFQDYTFVLLGLIEFYFINPDAELKNKIVKIANNMDRKIMKAIDEINEGEKSYFLGNLNSQEDTSIPSPFSLYERVIEKLKFMDVFLEERNLSSQFYLDTIHKYPMSFTFRLGTNFEKFFYVLRGKLDGSNIFKLKEEIGYPFLYFERSEDMEDGKYMLCNSSSCVLNGKTLAEVKKYIDENVKMFRLWE